MALENLAARILQDDEFLSDVGIDNTSQKPQDPQASKDPAVRALKDLMDNAEADGGQDAEDRKDKNKKGDKKTDTSSGVEEMDIPETSETADGEYFPESEEIGEIYTEFNSVLGKIRMIGVRDSEDEEDFSPVDESTPESTRVDASTPESTHVDDSTPESTHVDASTLESAYVDASIPEPTHVDAPTPESTHVDEASGLSRLFTNPPADNTFVPNKPSNEGHSVFREHHNENPAIPRAKEKQVPEAYGSSIVERFEKKSNTMQKVAEIIEYLLFALTISLLMPIFIPIILELFNDLFKTDFTNVVAETAKACALLTQVVAIFVAFKYGRIKAYIVMIVVPVVVFVFEIIITILTKLPIW